MSYDNIFGYEDFYSICVGIVQCNFWFFGIDGFDVQRFESWLWVLFFFFNRGLFFWNFWNIDWIGDFQVVDEIFYGVR